MKKEVYYAVGRGHNPGVYTSWNEAKEQVTKYQDAKYKKFDSQEEATRFVNLYKTPTFFKDLLEKQGIDVSQKPQEDSRPNANDCLIAFTDGACSNNGKSNAVAGYSVVWPDYPDYTISSKVQATENQTNNRAEYTGFLVALKQAAEIDPSLAKKLYIYTDSMLLVNSVTKWIKKWKLNGWKTSTGEPVKNQDLLEDIDRRMFARSRVIVEHVLAHTNKSDWKSLYNNEADQLARQVITTTTSTQSLNSGNLHQIHRN